MRSKVKVMLLVWDILLTPSILLSALQMIGSPLLSYLISQPHIGPIIDGIALISAVVSSIFLPQIITSVLIVMGVILVIRDRYFCPLKREAIHMALLSIWSILGTICTLLLLMIVSSGEAGKPLP